jgi:hypothetical protein
MKKYINYILISILIISCTPKTLNQFQPFDKSNITSEKLWTRITKEENYKSYSFLDDHKGLKMGKTPHGRFHKIVLNPRAIDSIKNKEKRIQNGGIIVKENYNSNKELQNFTIMTKIEKYDPEHNDWYWAIYDKKGKSLGSGKIEECISCHMVRENNDYIMIKDIISQEE